MGHYASEIDPEGWARSIERSSNKRRLREKVDNMPLSKFKGSDFPILRRLYSYDDLYRDDIKRLEEL
jgi:hypothetical protein